MQNGDPSLADIRQRAVTLIKSSLSESTTNAYKTAMNHFNNFRAAYNLPLSWPIPTDQLVLYISYCYEKGYAPSTIKLHISGISFAHKLEGLSNPCENFITKKMLEGYNSRRQQNDCRAPILKNTLIQIIGSLTHVCFSKFETELFTVAFHLAYFGLFRISELVVTSQKMAYRALAKSDVIIGENAITVRLRYSKTNQCGRPTYICIPHNEETNQFILSLKSYTKINTVNKSPFFFSHANGKPLTRYQFSSVLSKAYKFIGTPSKILSHSFQIGRATDLAKQGIPEDKIKQMGRWSSNTYSRYIRL